MNALIRQLYALFIAGAVVAFVGLGISSLYQAPKYPSFPNYNYSSNSALQRQQDTYNRKVDQYKKDNKDYQRKATHLALTVSIIFVAAGVYLFRRTDVIGEGLALGGAGVSIYAIVTASIADRRGLRFLAVTILLASLLLIAHRRFYVKPIKKA